MSDSSETRKRFTTTIDEDILLEFKVTCLRNKLGMNDVLEILMQAYTDGVINLKELSEWANKKTVLFPTKVEGLSYYII